jgi:hypothetical protein
MRYPKDFFSAPSHTESVVLFACPQTIRDCTLSVTRMTMQRDDVSDDSSDIIDVNDDESEGVSVSVNVTRQGVMFLRMMTTLLYFPPFSGGGVVFLVFMVYKSYASGLGSTNRARNHTASRT